MSIQKINGNTRIDVKDEAVLYDGVKKTNIQKDEFKWILKNRGLEFISLSKTINIPKVFDSKGNKALSFLWGVVCG